MPRALRVLPPPASTAASRVLAVGVALIRLEDDEHGKNEFSATQARARKMSQRPTRAAATVQDADVAALRDPMEMVFAALQP